MANPTDFLYLSQALLNCSVDSNYLDVVAKVCPHPNDLCSHVLSAAFLLSCNLSIWEVLGLALGTVLLVFLVWTSLNRLIR